MILDPRINKAILKCAGIVVRINLKPDLKHTDKPSAQDKMPPARQTAVCSSLILIFTKNLPKPLPQSIKNFIEKVNNRIRRLG